MITIEEFVERELARAPKLTEEQASIISRAFRSAKSESATKDEWDV